MSPAEFNFALLQTALLAGIWIGVVILVMQPRGEEKAIERAREIVDKDGDEVMVPLPLLASTWVGPVWIKCECCDDFWCKLHNRHAHDCLCPPLEDWIGTGIDPYLGKIDGE